MIQHWLTNITALLTIIVGVIATAAQPPAALAQAAKPPIKVFVLAGDDLVLEHAAVQGKKPNTPGTLKHAVANNPAYAMLRNDDGKWVTRDDVLLYDSHPVTNNTRATASPVTVGNIGRSGPERTEAIGVEVMLAHTLGQAFDQPVLIIRHGVKHKTWFRRGSRNLAHDYRPPSSGGGIDHDGNWDVIHFNHGIHDTGYRNPDDYKQKDENKYPIYMPIDQYEANLRKIVTRLKKTGATLIWARTTPVRDDTHGWKAADIDRYNAVADKIMKEHGVIINDLHAESVRKGFPKAANVHSVGNLAPKVTEAIRDAIAKRKNNTKPLPRVLFIGDSITGTYWGKVKADLDGEAYVCKNPANAGPSDRGVENLEAWIKLDTYLLNGQEYNQLVAGVREALKRPDHVIPNYDGRPLELAGLVWFQGIADTKSEAKSKAYEQHLANLIRDLRKNWGVPNLPVVVTGLATSKRKMSVAQQAVFDAQMAMSDPAKYPEFVGNAISIDTRSMCQPTDQSPGGRDPYAGNALTYLQIGQAMGEAMITLQDQTTPAAKASD